MFIAAAPAPSACAATPSPRRCSACCRRPRSRGGYDGKGVFPPADRAAAADLLHRHGGPLLAEERVDLVRELSAQVARSPFGQVRS